MRKSARHIIWVAASYTLTGWDDCYASGNCYTHSRIQ